MHGNFLVSLQEIGIALAHLPFIIFALLSGIPGFVIAPFVQHIFQKFCAPAVAGFAALAPVGYKFGQLLPDKLLWNIVLRNLPQ